LAPVFLPVYRDFYQFRPAWQLFFTIFADYLAGIPMLPRIILHTAVSLDGRITGFPADLELYYTLAAQYNPDAVLFGSATILAAPSLDAPAEHREMFAPPPGAPDPRPLMIVADSRGRIRCWEKLKAWPYVRDFVALCSSSTPREYLEYLASCGIHQIIAGDRQVDMRHALEQVSGQFGVRTVRADSGGTFNSVLLSTGLVDTVSVLVHPCIAGGNPEPTLFDPLRAGIGTANVPLTLTSCQVQKNGIVWLQYAVAAGPEL
jgi:2,5-diamino-6-(ribosylamino)-4(3H)-pyrimidinone 5'-phosphate reductase